MIGIQEVILILVVLLFVFGPKKLPELARELGKAMQEFKKASSNIADSVLTEAKAEEDPIFKLAKQLKIDTTDKSIQQLIKEITEIKEKG